MEELRTADNILKIVDQPLTLENFIKSWNLNQPPNIMRDELIVDHPFCKVVPFVDVTIVDKLRAAWRIRRMKRPVRTGHKWRDAIQSVGIYSVPDPWLILCPSLVRLWMLNNRKDSLPCVSSARYFPFNKLSVLRKISRRREDPVGLYRSLNLSNRWNSCTGNVSQPAESKDH